MKKTLDDFPIEVQERFEYVSLLFKDRLLKLLRNDTEDIDEERAIIFLMASKEFFNLFHDIVTPEMVWKLETTEEFKLLDPETIEAKLVNGNTLTFKCALPPQGTWNGESWHGIVDLKRKMGFEI